MENNLYFFKFVSLRDIFNGTYSNREIFVDTFALNVELATTERNFKFTKAKEIDKKLLILRQIYSKTYEDMNMNLYTCGLRSSVSVEYKDFIKIFNTHSKTTFSSTTFSVKMFL